MESSSSIKRFFSGTLAFLPGVLILIFVFNFSFILSYFSPVKDVLVGSVAPETIKSPKTIYYKSQIKTDEAQKRAQDKIQKVYLFDTTVIAQQKAKTETIFQKLDNNRANKDITNIVKDTSISEEAASYVVGLSDQSWADLKNTISLALDTIQQKEKVKDDETLSKAFLDSYLGLSEVNDSRFVKEELVSSLLIPNYVYSKQETQQEIDKAISEIEPVSLLVVKDEVIVPSGKVIDKEDLEKLEAAGYTKGNIFSLKSLGQFLLALILSLLSYVYFKHLYKIPKSILISRERAFYVFVTFLSLSVILFEIITPIKPIIFYLFPVAAPIMIITILINVETAFFSAVVLSLFLGGILSSSIELACLYLITSLVGVYRSRFVKKIDDIFAAGFILAFFAFFVSLSFHLLSGAFSVKIVSSLLGAAVVYGLGGVVFIIGTLLFWGRLFKITTLVELMELENPYQKIIKDLTLEAPGTYHHSVLVSNLSQQAAKDIGADVLLSSVGALYHDIGKLVNPEYYIENQSGKNIHDEIKDPEKSAQIIKEHVSQGIFMAKKERLPREIIHIIESHHGTSEVFYFLNKAKQENRAIDFKNFKYDGPIPATKEAGIIMLADSVEARSRAESSLNKHSINAIVEDVVAYKLGTGQLDACPISLGELAIIKRSFISVLGNIHHKRIKYENGKEKK